MAHRCWNYLGALSQNHRLCIGPAGHQPKAPELSVQQQCSLSLAPHTEAALSVTAIRITGLLNHRLCPLQQCVCMCGCVCVCVCVCVRVARFFRCQSLRQTACSHGVLAESPVLYFSSVCMCVLLGPFTNNNNNSLLRHQAIKEVNMSSTQAEV